MKRMFNRSNFMSLDLFIRDDAIYAINQEIKPDIFIEKTSSQTPRSFRHALIRQKVNNMKNDTWPCVVFEEQLRIVYCLQIISDLLRPSSSLIIALSPSELENIRASILVHRCRVITENEHRIDINDITLILLSKLFVNRQLIDRTSSNEWFSIKKAVKLNRT